MLLNNQHPSEMAHSVSIDNTDGGYQATEHLIALGHRDIAYIGDESGLHSDDERLAGFHEAMNKARIKVRKELVVRGNGKQPMAGNGPRNCWHGGSAVGDLLLQRYDCARRD